MRPRQEERRPTLYDLVGGRVVAASYDGSTIVVVRDGKRYTVTANAAIYDCWDKHGESQPVECDLDAWLEVEEG